MRKIIVGAQLGRRRYELARLVAAVRHCRRETFVPLDRSLGAVNAPSDPERARRVRVRREG